VRQDKIMQDENSSSLSNAKEQLQVQAQQLSDAQQQVDELLQAQMRLKAMLISPPGVASSTGAPQPGDSAGDAAKASEARVLLGKAVRRQTEQQLQIEAMSASLRDEGTRALIACQKARDNQHQVEQLQEQLASLREQLSKEQRERMESEAASRKTEEQLKAKVGELQEQESRRLAQDTAMEEALGAMTNSEASRSSPAAPLVPIVAAPPPTSPPPGFNPSAGDFSL
jgi:hypothetical protein